MIRSSQSSQIRGSHSVAISSAFIKEDIWCIHCFIKKGFKTHKCKFWSLALRSVLYTIYILAYLWSCKQKGNHFFLQWINEQNISFHYSLLQYNHNYWLVGNSYWIWIERISIERTLMLCVYKCILEIIKCWNKSDFQAMQENILILNIIMLWLTRSVNILHETIHLLLIIVSEPIAPWPLINKFLCSTCDYVS